MVHKISRCLINISLILLISPSLISCTGQHASQARETPQGTYPVEPIFREYYSDLGGQDLLGPAISQVFTQESLECQYTVAVLMCYDPLLTGAGRYRLFPLGRKTGIKDNPDVIGEPEEQRVIDGHVLYPGFVAAYETLRGAQNTGALISGIRYNYELQRIEQYFENIGFFQKFDETPDNVHLLPYGAAYCEEKCAYQLEASNQFILDKKIRTPFAAKLEPWGGMRVFGRPISDPYTAPDGSVEQIYENAVIFSPPDQNNSIGLRPLAMILGMTTNPPGPQLYGQERQVVFYNLSNDMGYHVPILFDEFINAHGGIPVSGNPIAELMYYDKKILRQCFENYCLDLFGEAEPALRVRLAPLGLRYLEQVNPADILAGYIPPKGLKIQIEEKAPQITSKEAQSIGVLVYSIETQQPQANIPVRLELTLPNGAEYSYDFPATSNDGQTRLDLPSLRNIPGGSLISYRVCLDIQSDPPVCENDAFLIWNP